MLKILSSLSKVLNIRLDKSGANLKTITINNIGHATTADTANNAVQTSFTNNTWNKISLTASNYEIDFTNIPGKAFLFIYVKTGTVGSNSDIGTFNFGIVPRPFDDLSQYSGNAWQLIETRQITSALGSGTVDNKRVTMLQFFTPYHTTLPNIVRVLVDSNVAKNGYLYYKSIL